MPRFFFDLHNGLGFVRDDEGQVVPDEATARTVAVDNIRSLLSAEVRAGALDLRGRIDVRAEGGVTVLRVPFDEAVRIRPAEGAPE